MTSYMKFFQTQKKEEQNPDGSFFSYPEFCIDTNPLHKAAMTVQEVYILEQDSRIAALEAQKARLVEALEKIKRQDPYTTTNKSFFDFVYNTAIEALAEVTQ